MSDPHKTEQALHSVESATNAVEQAEAHPSGRMIEQADNSLVSAEIAVRQATDRGNESEELSNAVDQLEEDRAVLDGPSS